MTREEIKSHLVASLVELFEIPREDITESSSLYDDLDIDSIDMMDLLLRLNGETNANLEFEPEQFREVRTLGDVLDVLENLE